MSKEATVGLLGAAGSAIGAAYGFDAASKIESRANTIASDLNTLGANLNSNSQFKGYGVSKYNLSPNADTEVINQARGMMGSSMNAMNNAMQPTAQREQDIYQRMMAMQNPQLDRAQAQQQALEYARGRGGIRGSLYGGTAEDAAMAKARVDASNQASLMAMNQALAEQQQQTNMANTFGQLGQGQFATGYLPAQQSLEYAKLGQLYDEMAQTGQLTGLGYQAQMALGGQQTQVNALKTAAELRGNVIDSILDNLIGGDGLFGAIVG